jgi:beta-lactamase regulating signal transducer with metallopeptidase domain
MMASVMLSGVVAVLVYLAGRKDAARDPRLTGVALSLLAVFPLLAPALPKFAVFSVREGAGVEHGYAAMAVVLGIWAVGFGVAALRLARAAATLAQWRAESRLLERVGRIEIRERRGLTGPVAAGVFQPVVYVPEGWTAWSDRIRRMVLDHETAHHHRRDPLWRWLAEIAGAVHWPNPLVGWMVRRFALQCEYACDARVLRQGVAAGD